MTFIVPSSRTSVVAFGIANTVVFDVEASVSVVEGVVGFVSAIDEIQPLHSCDYCVLELVVFLYKHSLPILFLHTSVLSSAGFCAPEIHELLDVGVMGKPQLLQAFSAGAGAGC